MRITQLCLRANMRRMGKKSSSNNSPESKTLLSQGKVRKDQKVQALSLSSPPQTNALHPYLIRQPFVRRQLHYLMIDWIWKRASSTAPLIFKKTATTSTMTTTRKKINKKTFPTLMYCYHLQVLD